MPSREVVVAARVGLHARPAKVLVEVAKEQPVTVRICTGTRPPVDARSILAVLGLGAKHGETVTIEADGDGAEAALDAVADVIARDLDAPAESGESAEPNEPAGA